MTRIRSVKRIAKSHLYLLMFTTCISSCRSDVSEGTDVSNEIQSQRAEIIRSFYDRPVESTAKYSSYFSKEEAAPSQTKLRLGQKLVIAGQLIKYDAKNREVYRSFIKSQLENNDPELQGLATSALYQDSSIDSMSILLTKMQSKYAAVRIEAVAAAKYMLASLEPSMNADDSRILEAADNYCKHQENVTNSDVRSFCAQVVKN